MTATSILGNNSSNAPRLKGIKALLARATTGQTNNFVANEAKASVGALVESELKDSPSLDKETKPYEPPVTDLVPIAQSSPYIAFCLSLFGVTKLFFFFFYNWLYFCFAQAGS
jgi:hypothetical protein